MRAVVQRVREAKLSIDGVARSAIGEGLVVLVGIEPGDGASDVQWMSGKLVRMRIFRDDAGAMNRSLLETGGEILLVSQFTLFAAVAKGNRPSFSKAARPELARPTYDDLVQQLTGDLGKPIATGVFGAEMQIELVNDGPVTILIDTKVRE